MTSYGVAGQCSHVSVQNPYVISYDGAGRTRRLHTSPGNKEYDIGNQNSISRVMWVALVQTCTPVCIYVYIVHSRVQTAHCALQKHK